MIEVQVPPLDLGRLDLVLEQSNRRAFHRSIDRGRQVLGGRTLWSVNSTGAGGGVAEMLRSLLGYVRGVGIDGRWLVIDGDEAFFQVTKRLHNRLHGTPGDGGPLGPDEAAAYQRQCDRNADALADLVRPNDIVLLHDPQTAGMVPALVDRGVGVVWRSHIGVDESNELAREAWDFLRPSVVQAHCCVFSRRRYAWRGLPRRLLRVIPPSVDAFSAKNQTLGFTQIAAILSIAGLSGDEAAAAAVFARLDGTTGHVRRSARMVEDEAVPATAPLVTQVSRWDRLKDPVGVLTMFSDHLADLPVHLVLAGPDPAAVADDPEGAEVFDEVAAARDDLPADVRRRTHLALLPMDDIDENAAIVNALQRRSDVVVQNSVAEGFGLTVAEAMWKGRPTVARRVGGIQDQLEDGRSGYLVDPGDVAALGSRVAALLRDPPLAELMGMAAHERVKAQFLAPRHLIQWVKVVDEVSDRARRAGG